MLIRFVHIFLSLSIVGFISASGAGKVPGNMALVQGGIFQMGDNQSYSDEEPVHNVTLDSFFIGRYEVTQQEWMAVMGNNPAPYRGDDLPVQDIDWYVAIEYCNKRSRMEGLTPCYSGSGDNIACNFAADGYRLPTEAEWEYAARGGLKSGHLIYSGSNNADEVAWYETNCKDSIQPVGKKKANELGIYDMSGNIWEWCWDIYEPGYYKESPAKNPQGPANAKKRVYRGGGGPGGRIEWLRCTARYNLDPTYKSFDMGFRIARNTNGNKVENMVLVEGGTFPMGSNDGGSGERPSHPVSLNSFYIGIFEVTQEEWNAAMGKNPSYWIGSKLPVDSITWYDAVEYCNRRSRMEGLNPCYKKSGDDVICDFAANGYRLPTEAEWEYAGRGGTLSANYKYSGSNNPGEVGWYAENSTFK
ncbi:MAG TPA: SUMF1/EgtB/PvdO family nonheme iron enzyme, partial [Candidatus Deferrimicrobium sp.]|nr:SUMF1/EgtB/PvdO family nonheme iron enzyme [Candidatus Deferrimicrobium sp.]